MIVEVAGLKKAYGEQVALAGVDLRLEEGGILGLLGPNGAGKTTFVEILEGLRAPTEGRVRVLGLDPTQQPDEVRERLGVQLQSTTLPQELTCREVVQLFGSFYRRALPADDVLARVDLAGKANARVQTLSGGMAQRLALGLALVNDPALLLLDEPTSGLDPAARRALHQVIRGLKAAGRTVLLTTHYIEEAEVLCDRVVVLKSGRIVADGTPFELVGRSSGSSTIWLAVDGPLDPAPLLAAGATAQGRQGSHHVFATSDPTATVLALGEILKGQRVRLTDLRMKRPTLEDVYLELMDGVPEQADEHQEATA